MDDGEGMKPFSKEWWIRTGIEVAVVALVSALFKGKSPKEEAPSVGTDSWGDDINYGSFYYDRSEVGDFD